MLALTERTLNPPRTTAGTEPPKVDSFFVPINVAAMNIALPAPSNPHAALFSRLLINRYSSFVAGIIECLLY